MYFVILFNLILALVILFNLILALVNFIYGCMGATRLKQEVDLVLIVLFPEHYLYFNITPNRNC